MDSLSTSQQAELFLDATSDVLEDKAVVEKVFKSFAESPNDDKLGDFYKALSNIATQVKIFCA